MLYKILYNLEDTNPNTKVKRRNNRTIKKNPAGLAKGGGKKTKKNKTLSILKNKKNKTSNMEKQYRQKQTTDRRNKWKNSK